MDTSADISQLLRQASAGDATSLQRLFPVVYDELRILAHAQHRQLPDPTLNTTALVHETYLKLVGREELSWPDRRHFYAYAAKAMRSILVNNARQRAAQKRGGNDSRDDAALDCLVMPGRTGDLLVVDQALEALTRLSPRLCEVVELHVFAGLEFREIAACLAVNERTVFRDWRKARALLHDHLAQTPCTD